MSCRICGRCSCTSSFHSLEEQESFDKYSDLDTFQLIRFSMEKDYEIEDLKRQIEELEEELREYAEAQPPI